MTPAVRTSPLRKPTHSARLERWLGADELEHLSGLGRGWYGKPIPVRGVPGAVFVDGNGDFVGPINGGGAANLLDFAGDHLHSSFRRWERKQRYMAAAGFASYGDMISELTAGKGRRFNYNKVGTTGVVAGTNSLWRVGNQPPAGAAAAAAPGGTAYTDATTGAFPFTNPSGGDTQWLCFHAGTPNIVNNTLLLYDRLFGVAVNMNSTATQAVTGVPTRYQSTTSTDGDYCGSNFLFFECGTVLAAAAHNWTVCQYTNQANTGGQNLPSLTGNSGNIVNRLDMPLSQWFAPLATGDVGIKLLTQVQLSAAVATGACDAVIGRPLAFLPNLVVNAWWALNLITDGFQMERVFDDACLSFLELTKPATGATTYNGEFRTVSG